MVFFNFDINIFDDLMYLGVLWYCFIVDFLLRIECVFCKEVINILLVIFELSFMFFIFLSVFLILSFWVKWVVLLKLLLDSVEVSNDCKDVLFCMNFVSGVLNIDNCGYRFCRYFVVVRGFFDSWVFFKEIFDIDNLVFVNYFLFELFLLIFLFF